MQSRIVLIIFSLTLSFARLFTDVASDESASLYDKALTAYQGGNYRKTLELLRSLDQQTAEMFYLMGSAASRLSQHGYALAYWRAAQRVWPIQGRMHLASVIAQVKKKVGVELTLPTTTRATIAVSDVLRAVPLFLIQLIFLALWTFLFIYLRYLYQKKHRTLVVGLFIMLFSTGVVLVAKISVDRTLQAVVVVPTTPILSGPGKTFHNVGAFKEGTEIKVVKTSDGFYKVRLGRLVGWVMKDHVVMTANPCQ